MELYVRDRLFIPSFLPKEGTFRQFNIKKEILRKIEISQDECDELELRKNEENDSIEWNSEKEKPLIVEFTREELEFLKEVCEQVASETKPDEAWPTIEKVYDAIQESAS